MSHFDTIVVGGGVAGLAAARALHRAGQHVVILESRDRVGGRVWSTVEDGNVTDRGASWIHGISESKLYKTVTEFGMRTLEFTVGSYQPGGRPIAYYAPDGSKLVEPESESFITDVHTFDEHLAHTIAEIAPSSSYSDAVEKTLSDLHWTAPRSERVREFMRHRTEEQYGAWIEDLDAHGLDDDRLEGDEVVFPDGYAELARHLATDLDVRLNHEVDRIQWNESGVVISAGTETFTANRAVVTVPIGVLQSPDFIIDPPLPDQVAGAISRMKMNAFEKVFLRFEKKFWDQDVYAIRRQGQAAEWWHSWYDLTATSGTPTLLTFIAGPAAKKLKDWSDTDIAESVLASLREIYGDQVPVPTGITVTRWQDDPWSHGSYAYMTVGSTPEDHDAIATPVGGVLHLAGEATWTDDPATVPGAFLSGERAANRILGATAQR